MIEAEARKLLEKKCAEPVCWLRSSRSYIYCICCLHEKCSIIPEEQRPKLIEAMQILGGN